VPVIVAALYAARSILRGSWRLELPMDALILVLVVVVMVVVRQLRDIAEREESDESDQGASRDDAEGPRD
jgi:hypothetical protein